MSSTETFEFKTEVKQLLDLVIHSLYSHKEIFLRELISNATDAIDKLRFELLTNTDLLSDVPEWKIKLIADKKNKTLTISDNGIGMNHEELMDQLGTIAKSGTKTFLEQIKQSKAKDGIELIGQFGVGFYSSFMVADKVSVVSRKAGESTAYKWESTGEGEFTIDEAERDQQGTSIILHLKADETNFLEEWELRQLVKKYSDFIEHPIVMDIEREEKMKDADGNIVEDAKPEKIVKEETLNSRKAIWLKPKKDVSKEEYTEFYKHLSHDYQEPLETIHYSAEGTSEFKALIYIPGKAPYDLYTRDSVKGISLYIKRVFIMNDCKELLPEYLRFIKGVVDSSDLPLNVSREILQKEAQLEKIKKNLVKKILSTFKSIKEKAPEKYTKFYTEFGNTLKEGLHYDYGNKETLADLLMFETTKTTVGEKKSIEDYINNMPEDQKDIYYITAESRETALASPHLEIFNSKGYEVLLMIDPIDDVIMDTFTNYKDKNLKAVNKGDIDFADESEKDNKKEDESNKTYSDLLSFIGTRLQANIKEVKLSSRLTDSVSCLVADQHAMSANMERMFKAMGQDVPVQKRILEINPNHPLTTILQDQFKTNPASEDLNDYIQLIYDQALLTEGSKIENPLNFSRKMTEIMIKAAKKEVSSA